MAEHHVIALSPVSSRDGGNVTISIKLKGRPKKRKKVSSPIFETENRLQPQPQIKSLKIVPPPKPPSILQRYLQGKPYPVYHFPNEAKIPIMKGEEFYQAKKQAYYLDPTGWWVSEKLDGYRAIWTGKELLSSRGNPVPAPDWFTAGFPKNISLDGELYLGRDSFYELASIVKNWEAAVQHPEQWKRVTYHVFDIPDSPPLKFEEVSEILRTIQHRRIVHIPQLRLKSLDHLLALQHEWISGGAEGSMLRKPGSIYQLGRTGDILKFKSQLIKGRLSHLLDDDAIITGYKYNYDQAEPGGQIPIRSLVARWADSKKFPLNPEFHVSHCLTQEQKRGDYETLFPVGQKIRVLYTQLLKDNQKPRFPRYGGWVMS